MNLGITLARTGGSFEVITGPEVPFSEQRRNFRNLRKSLAGSIDELQLWSSGQGRVKRQTFSKSPVVQLELASEESTTTGTESGDSSASIALAPAEAPAEPLTGLAKVNAERKAAKAAAGKKSSGSSAKSGSKTAGKAKAAAKAAKA